jgi:16S rRNA (guanine966-N2)-methyltransferase
MKGKDGNPRTGQRAATHARGAAARRLRIIAGRWRGRRWQFPDSPMRPTGDRVRETLFNWLQGRVAGRRCLDLYAGSGALGLEALSRGAAHCEFVDHDAQAAAAIALVLREWQADPASHAVHAQPAARFLAGTPRAFDLVFLDPPFTGRELEQRLQELEAGGWLAPGCLVYIEHPRESAVAVPAAWQALRQGTAGAVGYDLYERRP